MIYECPQCGDVFQTDVPAPVCDNCGGPMRETVGDFDPETGALWHVWRMDPIDARLEANRLWQELREVATALGNVGCPTPQMDALRNDLTARLRSAADDVHALVVHPSTARKPATPAPAVAGGDAERLCWRCQGRGFVGTGIDEWPEETCKTCGGEGSLLRAATPAPAVEREAAKRFDLPWRAATGWLRSASGSKIAEIGGYQGIRQDEAELIAAAVNAYTAPPAEAREPDATRAEAAAPAPEVEADDLPREDETEDEFLIRRLSTLLAEIAVIVKGPEPARTSWSYHDLPDLVRALKARVAPVRNLPPNPPPAKPARMVVTHEVAVRGPDWLREDMLALADGVERGEIAGVLWPETLREWAAALAHAAPPEADRTAGEDTEARAMVARAVEGWKVYEEGGYQVVAHHPDFGEVRGDTRSPRLANWALVVTLRDVIATTKPLNNITRLLATAPIKAEALAAHPPAAAAPPAEAREPSAGGAVEGVPVAERVPASVYRVPSGTHGPAQHVIVHGPAPRATGDGQEDGK